MMRRKKNIADPVTELSDVISAALAKNPGLLDRLSAQPGGRSDAALLGRVCRKYISMNERRRIARQKFSELHNRELKNQQS